MKAIFLTEEGRVQVVLDPETEFEREIINKLQYHGNEKQFPWKVHFGSYYACQGGWTRQSDDRNCMIFVCDKEVPSEKP